jgi:hypothetical protein
VVVKEAAADWARRSTSGKKRYYDFNIRNQLQLVEKLRYIHRNPVKRRLRSHNENLGARLREANLGYFFDPTESQMSRKGRGASGVPSDRESLQGSVSRLCRTWTCQ